MVLDFFPFIFSTPFVFLDQFVDRLCFSPLSTLMMSGIKVVKEIILNLSFVSVCKIYIYIYCFYFFLKKKPPLDTIKASFYRLHSERPFPSTSIVSELQ